MIVYIPRADGMRDVSNQKLHLSAVFDRFPPGQTRGLSCRGDCS